MDKRALREALDAYAADRLPASTELWPAIRARALAQRQVRRAAIGAPPGASGTALTPLAPRRTRHAWRAGANAGAVVALLLAFALTLALTVGGMNRRYGGGALGPAPATPALPVVPPAQPYPVPADCATTPLRGPEERNGFTAYWIESNGVGLGLHNGVLYQGLTAALPDVEIAGASGRRGDGQPVQLSVYNRRDNSVAGAIWFPDPGCWTVEARGRANWRSGWVPITFTVYVYPIACPHEIIPNSAPGPIGPSLPCRPPEQAP